MTSHPGSINARRGPRGGAGWGVALLLLAGSASGQASQPIMPVTEPRPEPYRPSAESWTLPDQEDSASWISSPTIVPEGTFLVRQSGLMVKAPTGEWLFSPGNTADGRPLPAMVMVPGRVLARMETAAEAESDSGSAAFEINAQVLLYDGRNYALVSSFSQLAGTAEDPTATGEGDETPPARPDDSNLTPALQILISDLEQSRSAGRRGLVPTEAADPQTRAPVAEGTFLTRRRARLVRLAGGEWGASFDSGIDQADQGALVIVPCAALQRMEAIAANRSENLSFELSGRVLDYGGRSYVLPTVLRLYPPSELTPLQ